MSSIDREAGQAFDPGGCARLLADARSHGIARNLPELSAQPTTLDEAYRVQDAVTGAGKIGGWKISKARPGSAHAFESAPIMRTDIHASPARLPVERHAYVECEIGLVMNRDMPAAGFASRDEAIAAIGECRAVLEVLGTRWATGLGATPQYALLADCAANAAVIMGDSIPLELLDNLEGLKGRLESGDAMAGAASKPVRDDPVDMLVALGQSLHARGLVLRKGQVVITGAVDYAAVAPTTMTGLFASGYRATVQFAQS